jgi:predicted 2-oxoglutarate/Fe(II)-dependent dioxygenase YbiX
MGQSRSQEIKTHLFLLENDEYESPIIQWLNTDEEIQAQMKKAESCMEPSTYKVASTDERLVDQQVRFSNISAHKLQLRLIFVSNFIKEIHSTFEYLTYPIGGHFVDHIDYRRKISEPNDYYYYYYDDMSDDNGDKDSSILDKTLRESNATYLILPPQDVEGGALVITNSKGQEIHIRPDPEKWIHIIFECGIVHRSEPVTRGTKVILKGTAIVTDSR